MNEARESRVRYGMVGGGEGAFIGSVHRIAAALDGECELVCGSFSSDEARNQRSGRDIGIDEERVYADFLEMMQAESELPASKQMEFVVIVTPNHLHFAVAEAALNAGIHVLSEKPATFSLEEARRLRELVSSSDCLYGLTHPYTAYPMIAEACERIAHGELGTIKKVVVEYFQGWLSESVEEDGNVQAAWRLDPAKAGKSGCFADIGVHAFNLAEFVSGCRVTAVAAQLNVVVAGRRLDDDGAALVRFDNGATGIIAASQVCTGEENDLRLRVYGDRAGIEWRQMEPNSLWLKHNTKSAELIRTASSGTSNSAMQLSRVPAGHPEGYLEAFANLYRAFADAVRARRGLSVDDGPNSAESSVAAGVPGIEAALRGMAFIETVVNASASDTKWHALVEVDE